MTFLGAIYRAKVVENLSDNYIILSFNGSLITVKNSTGLKYLIGAHVFLEVRNMHPLTFKLLPQSPTESL